MKSIQDRRKQRALEARRDALLEKQTKAKTELAKVRVEIKASRKK